MIFSTRSCNWFYFYFFFWISMDTFLNNFIRLHIFSYVPYNNFLSWVNFKLLSEACSFILCWSCIALPHFVSYGNKESLQRAQEIWILVGLRFFPLYFYYSIYRIWLSWCVIIKTKFFSLDFILRNNRHIIMHNRFGSANFYFVDFLLFHHGVHFLFVLFPQLHNILIISSQFAIVSDHCLFNFRNQTLLVKAFTHIGPSNWGDPLF